MKIKKAIIPVAGKGTRFLPATKQLPKEMIPIIKKPMLHYIIDEAVGAGIEEIIFVTSKGKESIENYFDRNMELEQFLLAAGKEKEAEMVKKIGTTIEVVSIRQKEQLGLGHAILCAKNIVGNENFAVLLGDDLIINNKYPVTKQLIDVSKNYNNSAVIGVMDVPKSDVSKYGIVAGQYTDESKLTMKMSDMVEKPIEKDAPSTLATPGRYILTPQIFSCLEKIKKGSGGEYQLTDAIKMLTYETDVYAHQFTGKRYDTGTVEGYLQATVDFALESDETTDMMKKIILKKAQEL